MIELDFFMGYKDFLLQTDIYAITRRKASTERSFVLGKKSLGSLHMAKNTGSTMGALRRKFSGFLG